MTSFSFKHNLSQQEQKWKTNEKLWTVNDAHYSSVPTPVPDIILFSTPLVIAARLIASPPLIDVWIPHWRQVGGMEKWTHATPELRVNKVTAALPLEVFFVQSLILAEQVQILCQMFRRREIFHVYEGMRRSHSQVIFLPRSHHDWYDVISAKQDRICCFCQIWPEF